MKFSLVSLAAIASLTLAEFTDVLNGVSNANDEVLAELQTLPVANLADLTSKLAAQKAKIEALSSQAPTSDTFTIQANDVSVFQKQIADQTVQFAEGPQSEALKGLSEKLSAQAAAIAGLVGSGDDEETTTQWETRTTTVTMLHTDVTEIIVASTETSTVPVSTSSTSLQPVAVAVASASAHASAKVNIFFGGKLDYSSSPFMKGALGNGTTYGNTTYVNGTESYVTVYVTDCPLTTIDAAGSTHTTHTVSTVTSTVCPKCTKSKSTPVPVKSVQNTTRTYTKPICTKCSSKVSSSVPVTPRNSTTSLFQSPTPKPHHEPSPLPSQPSPVPAASTTPIQVNGASKAVFGSVAALPMFIALL